METQLTERKESQLVSPAAIDETLEAVKRFEQFKAQVLKPTDYVTIRSREGEKRYIKKSGWMLYALACQVSLEKREEKVEKLDDGTIVYHYTYRAIAPSGRYADADGSAASNEKSFNHAIHDVRALAQTRACNRSISNLVAGGEVSAEEMEGSDHESKAESAKPVGSGAAKAPGRKVNKYFTSSKNATVKVPVSHPLYEELVNFCAVFKLDHPEIEYEMRRDPKDKDSLVSVIFQNISAGSEMEKTIDDMFRGIADAVSEAS